MVGYLVCTNRYIRTKVFGRIVTHELPGGTWNCGEGEENMYTM